MKSLLNESDTQEIIQRIEKLQPDSKALWGKMNPHQAVCHMTDQLRIAVKEKPFRDQSNFLLRTLAIRLIVWGMPAPKGKVQTVPELAQEKSGTKPGDFQKDRQELLRVIHTFRGMVNTDPGFKQGHPAFGVLNANDWGKLAWTHLNHHLAQFGV